MSLPASPVIAAGRLPLTVEIEAGHAARLVADFGRVVAGLVQLEVSAPAGTIFDLCYVEDPLTGKEQGFRRAAQRHPLHRPRGRRRLRDV